MEAFENPVLLCDFLETYVEFLTDPDLFQSAIESAIDENKNPNILDVLISSPGGRACLKKNKKLADRILILHPSFKCMLPLDIKPSEYHYGINPDLKQIRIDDVDDMKYAPLHIQIYLQLKYLSEKNWLTPQDLIDLTSGQYILRMQGHKDAPGEIAYSLIYLRPIANMLASQVPLILPYIGQGIIVEITAQRGHFCLIPVKFEHHGGELIIIPQSHPKNIVFID